MPKKINRRGKKAPKPVKQDSRLASTSERESRRAVDLSSPNQANISEQTISNEVQQSYLDYAMSVIVARALPDVRDGLKPVQRRVLYAMWDIGLRANAKFRKSANIVGEVMAKYHPHGDMAIYDTLVRMAQDFSLRHPLVKGQGNFGCFTKDTKVKLTDNRELSFEELIKEHEQGKKNFTFTIDDAGLIKIAEIKNPRLTQKRAEIMAVILDNGEEIKCTLNHKFMLCAGEYGEYKEAENLKTGDSLMPAYFKFSTKEDDLNMVGYNLLLCEINGNHKVAEIKFLNEFTDVYDLTIDKTHNFSLSAGIFVHNSMDGDSPAAHRYTEAKLAPIADEMLLDIEKNTVNFTPNYDGAHQEPRVLPAKLPNLLINGSQGIAVGMATNIPPHNLGEIIDGTIHLIDNPDCHVDDLVKFVKGPDFPTGGIIYNVNDIKQAYASGRGGVVCRAKTEIEETRGGLFRIIVSEVTYQTNKAMLLEKIAELVRDKKIEGIRDLRDESNKDGVRVVIELKKDSYPKKILNQLFKHTQLQSTFHFNMLALVDGIQPRVLNLKMVLEEYLKHRKEVVGRRTQFELDRAKERAHILEGLVLALAKIDQVIDTIKKSRDKEQAKENLIKKFKLSDRQAVAILEMKLQQLANLERLKVEIELKEKQKLIKDLEAILRSPEKIKNIIKDELKNIREKYAEPRRTQIVAHGVDSFKMEDLIANEDIMVMVTNDGYIKRLPPDTFKIQGRGGKGVIGLTTKEEDSINLAFMTNTHADLLFFTTRGRVFQLKGYDVPQSSRMAKGQALINFLQLSPNEKVSAILPSTDIENDKFLIMVTNHGTIKKTAIEDFANVRRSGLIAIKLKNGDNLEWVQPTNGKENIILVTANGQAIR
ncbi:hypothetical protein HZA71_02160, partial [Candidatus Falkowbacteria bacterium]|nr:hypothetical protein [Candidatus Falkowbacteria bacterium]